MREETFGPAVPLMEYKSWLMFRTSDSIK